jgi:pectate lyase
MKVIEDVSVKVVLSLKELADLEDRSIKTVDGENKKIFTIENASILKRHSSSSTKESSIMAEATIVLNNNSADVASEVNTMLKKLLKIKI